MSRIINSGSLLTIVFAIIFLFVSSYGQDKTYQKSDMKKMKQMQKSIQVKDTNVIDLNKLDINRDGKIFVCPMVCDFSDESKNCKECGMKLKEYSLSDAKKMLEKHGHKVMNNKEMLHEKMDSSKKNMMDSKMHESHELMQHMDNFTDTNKSANTTKLEIWNKVCPVMGKEVDPEAPTFEYKGKLYGFCCPGCDKKFRTDPKKYMKNLNEDGTKFLNN